MLLAGANVVYLEAYPLSEYSMYGAVPLREVKSKLLALRRAGKLDRVKMISLTNCTFDGIVYDVQRVMEECLAIKPDLVFLWDEAWFAFARFHPVYRNRTAMASARALRERLQDREYTQRYDDYLAAGAANPPSDDELLSRRLIPDPAKVRVRVCATQSTHKALTSLPLWTSAAARSHWRASNSFSAKSKTRCRCATRSTTIRCSIGTWPAFAPLTSFPTATGPRPSPNRCVRACAT
jgi:arginine decarboxylase